MAEKHYFVYNDRYIYNDRRKTLKCKNEFVDIKITNIEEYQIEEFFKFNVVESECDYVFYKYNGTYDDLRERFIMRKRVLLFNKIFFDSVNRLPNPLRDRFYDIINTSDMEFHNMLSHILNWRPVMDILDSIDNYFIDALKVHPTIQGYFKEFVGRAHIEAMKIK